ncbi:hypothetical protein GALMADRAFT_146442 [Galerina marginata CBS 339.88]|uniref:Uncharacterized protein n=1 Tax=Galerina marginata (strain CBS 339.88) TaxID=685588 RepID=A0A067SN38_GALM3|nr:hypothetical protein GALMADRAFT_146442 [Galerina marginata CBS 339.88]
MASRIVVRPLATSYFLPSRGSTLDAPQPSSQMSRPRRIEFFAWVLNDATRLEGYNRQRLVDALILAMNTEAVQTALRSALRGMEGVHLVATRAVASPSNTCLEPHFTIRVFVGSDGHRYLGGIHMYPAQSSTSPSFKPHSRRKANKWSKRKFDMSFFSITVM